MENQIQIQRNRNSYFEITFRKSMNEGFNNLLIGICLFVTNINESWTASLSEFQKKIFQINFFDPRIGIRNSIIATVNIMKHMTSIPRY